MAARLSSWGAGPRPGSLPPRAYHEAVMTLDVRLIEVRRGLSGPGLYEKSGSRAARRARWVGRGWGAALLKEGELCLILIA